MKTRQALTTSGFCMAAKQRTVQTIQWLLGVVCLCLSNLAATAAEPGTHERAFVKALELFDQAKSPDDYRASARELESIVADGIRNGAVYYNLGNAWFRAGEFGRAVLNYRKARPYRPRDPYLEANLQQALASAPGRLPDPPAPWWSHVLFWSNWFSSPAKVRLASLSLSLSAILLALAIVLRRKSLITAMAVVFALGASLSLECLLNDPAQSSRAVIVAETMARKGTGKDYEPAFDQPLRDGAEFSVLTETDDWVFGHFEGIGDGWVRKDDVAR
ncbi:MAG: tetratricopeptide repeat protein [Planctomycetaceae bacterium]